MNNLQNVTVQICFWSLGLIRLKSLLKYYIFVVTKRAQPVHALISNKNKFMHRLLFLLLSGLSYKASHLTQTQATTLCFGSGLSEAFSFYTPSNTFRAKLLPAASSDL